MKVGSYTKEQIENAVSKSRCYADIFRNLGVKVNGGSYPWIKGLIAKFGISTDHFYSKEELKAIRKQRFKNVPNLKDWTLPLEDGKRLHSKDLDKHLQACGVSKKCNLCGIDNWLGKQITLDIDHIDSNPFNNSLKNLQYLCPNCHRQKTMEHRASYKKTKKKSKCKYCDVEVSAGKEQCLSCFNLKRYGNSWPPNELLKKMVWEKPLTQIAKEVGVADTSVRKHCIRNNIPLPPRNFWTKK